MMIVLIIALIVEASLVFLYFRKLNKRQPKSEQQANIEAMLPAIRLTDRCYGIDDVLDILRKQNEIINFNLL